jgi:hypothetical protein
VQPPATESHDRVEAVYETRELIPDYAEIRARVLSLLPGVSVEMREAVSSYLEVSPRGVALPQPPA